MIALFVNISFFLIFLLLHGNFFLDQISQTGNLDSNLTLRHKKLGLIARFMEIKSTNPKLKQDQIAKE